MFARALTIALVMLLGCEKTDHENIDKWMETEKGPGKLRSAVLDEDIAPKLSAHAAANLVRIKKDTDARAALEKLPVARRTAVIAELAPRMWNLARVENPKVVPVGVAIDAKDFLFTLRKWADDAQKQQIDGYLMDWYAVESYEERAKRGAVLGPQVVRALGPAAGKKLMAVANKLIAAPGQDKERNVIGDELLLGMAASGNAEAVKLVLDIAKMPHPDKTLPERAMSALFKAYVDSGALFDIQSPEPLVPNLDAIVNIAKDANMPGRVINDAVALIRATGAPHCLVLVKMIGTPHKSSRFTYQTASESLQCGGAKVIADVVRALPDGAYDHRDLQGSISGEIAKLQPRDQVLTTLRELLGDKSTLVRWVAAEALVAMKSVEDAPKIAKLSGSKDRLAGFWGDNAEGKPDPTLGQRAKELADQLGKAK